MQRPSPFGTKIDYTCPLGMEHHIPHLNTTVPSVTLDCDWNSKWTPYTNLPHCIWVGCVDPPTPPQGHFMKSLYQVGNVVKVGEGENYTCEVGYFFGEDMAIGNYRFVQKKCPPAV